ncbi:MAG TPA: hypothetical protein EYH42_01955 [Sulfurovum sp.]|nr:hypothetical protein [Sulfurovum sp.]
MTIKIQNEEFDVLDIRQLYSAAIIKTDDKEGSKQISLEVLDKEDNPNIEIINYGIFVDLGDDDIYSFLFTSRDKLENALLQTKEQIRKQRNGQ